MSCDDCRAFPRRWRIHITDRGTSVRFICDACLGCYRQEAGARGGFVSWRRIAR